MSKIDEFCHIKKMEHSDTITLGTLAHFRHFRHLLLEHSWWVPNESLKWLQMTNND